MAIKKKDITRRRFLKRLGLSAAATPFLTTGIRSALAQTAGTPKRFIVFYTPNGKNMDTWGASGGTYNFQLKSSLQPMERHRQDLVIFDGIDMQTCSVSPGAAHPRGMANLLVGRPALAPVGPEAMGYASGASIDQHIANVIGQETAFRSLEFGVIRTVEKVETRINYAAAGQPISPEANPSVMFDRLFGSAGQMNGTTPSVKQRMFEFLRNDYTHLSQKIGQNDRVRLEGHLQHLSEIHAAMQQNAACEAPPLGEPVPLNLASSIPAIGRMQMDMLVAALRCDLTRVATLQWVCPAKEMIFDMFGHTRDHHILTHQTDAASRAQVTEVDTFFSEQLAYLVDALKAVPEGDGTLFDSTMILVCSEVSHGRTHGTANMPFMLVGNAGGAYQTGRYLSQLGGVSHNDLYVSCMNAMGVPGSTFGDSRFCNGPLSALT